MGSEMCIRDSTVFNLTTTLLLLPFGSLLVKLAVKLLPDRETQVMDADQWFEGLMASKHVLGVSTLAIAQISGEIRQMLETAAHNVGDSFQAVEGRQSGIEEIEAREDELDLWNVRLSQKISKVLVLDQTPRDILTLNNMFSIIGNIERIGDHAMNLAEYAQTIKEKNLGFSDTARDEIKTMEGICGEAMDILLAASRGEHIDLARAEELEQTMDDTTVQFRQNQIARMRVGHCNVESSILYSEMLTDYERIGDHVLNIAQAFAAIEGAPVEETAAAAQA